MAESAAAPATAPTTSTEGEAPAVEQYLVKITNQACYPQPAHRFEFKVPTTGTLGDVLEKITEETKYTADMISLNYFLRLKLPLDDLTVPLSQYFDQSKQQHTIFLYRCPELEGDQTANAKFTITQAPTVSSTPSAYRPYPSQVDGAASSYSRALSGVSGFDTGYSRIDWNVKSKTGFAGLSNQGATCYLNSLIQTLFMTPEFRDAVYKWNFEDWAKKRFEQKLAKKREEASSGGLSASQAGADQKSSEDRFEEWQEQTEKNSIPRQLQKLFLRLQLGDTRAESTEDLTKSFGWTQRDSFTQHDAQELCRVLFEALEGVWKGTEQENVIDRLYQGKMKDYVQCLNCGTESSRTDTYLDVPLVIKGFGETKAVGSIEEALFKFIEPEVLNGTNQYHCSKCNSPQDARKGLSFTSFPYLLTLQLKRFDFDFTYMKRIKLNDRVTFPEILDVNQFLLGKSALGEEDEKEDPVNEKETETKEFEGKGKDEAENTPVDESVKRKENADRQDQIDKALRNGPLVYELFSVLIHRGSAMGGHYYGYVRSFANGEWYSFDDSTVTSISASALQHTFGEKKSSGFGGGTNAYMLSYRQYDPARNMVEQSKDELSEVFKKMVEKEKEQREAKEKARENQRMQITAKVQHDGQLFECDFHKDDTLEKIYDATARHFKLEEQRQQGCFRLRDFLFELPGKPYEEPQLQESLERLNWRVSKNLIVELKEAEKPWIKYNPDHMNIKLFLCDPATNAWSKMQVLRFDRDTKLKTVKKMIEEQWGDFPAAQQVLTKEDHCSGFLLWGDEDSFPRQFGIYDSSKVWVELKQSDEKAPTRASQEITRLKNVLELSYNKLGSDKHDQTYLASKKQTYLELKKALSEIIGLPLDEFKVFKTQVNYKIELRDEEELLESLLNTTTRISIEKGKPLRSGEVTLKFVSFDPTVQGKQCHDLFKCSLPGKLEVKDAKQLIIDYYNELQSKEETKLKIPWVMSKNIRLRDLTGTAPKAIFLPTHTIKDLGKGYVYTVPEVAIQNLPEGVDETKSGRDDVVIFLQQFFPDTWTLGPRFEFTTHDDELLTEFRARVSAQTKIDMVALVSGENWSGPKILSIPGLPWNVPPPMKTDVVESPYTGGYQGKVRSLGLQDGDLLLFKDMNTALVTLSDDERKKLKKEDDAKRSAWNAARWPMSTMSYQSPAESGLKISEKDVAL